MSLTLVSNRNHLTIEEHITNIIDARENMKEGLYEFIQSIRNANEQLPIKSFQNELGLRLNMKKSVLSKWISIAQSKFIEKHLRKLPPSFSSLYTITLIEKKYIQMYPLNPQHYMCHLIYSRKLSSNSDRHECEVHLKRITQQIAREKQLIRHDDILSLSGGTLASTKTKKSIFEYLDGNKRFRSFVVIPSDEQISLWSDDGYLQMDIANDFPLHELRTPSITENVSCLIKVKMKRIDTGIKLLSSWGFSYRNVIVPPLTNAYCTILDEEYVMVRGERGQEKKLTNPSCFTLDTEDILDFSEQNYNGPNLLVFGDTLREDWSCSTN